MNSLQGYLLQVRQACLPGCDAGDQQPSRYLLLAVLVFLVALLVRSWGNLITPGLYMEDAGHYFNLYYGGKRSFAAVLQQPNGYYNILNNAVAWGAAKMDVRVQPLLYHLFSLGLGLAVAVCLTFSGLIRTRALLIVTPLALGLSGMNHIFYYVSLTFQMYNVVVLLLCLFFLSAPRTWAGTGALALLAALLIWSGPYSVVAVPVAVLYLLLFPFDKKGVLACWILVCTLGYTLFLEGGLIRFQNILDPTTRELMLSVLFGRVLGLELFGEVTGVRIGLMLAALAGIFFSFRRDWGYLKISLLLVAIIVASLAPLFLSNKILLYQRVFPCHIYVAQFFWVFFVLFTLDSFVQRQTRNQQVKAVASALAVLALVLTDNLRHPDRGAITLMPKVSAFVRAIHEAEQLALEEKKQYLVLRTENIAPGPLYPRVRVGSRSTSAKRLTAARVSLPTGNEFIAD